MPLTDIAPAPQRPNPHSWPDDQLTVAWLGHATVLLNFHGSWLLTDPALERRIGIGRGLAKLGPRRLVQPALAAHDLPALDAVLLSHAHMDHTDLGTLAKLPAATPIVVQRGNGDLVRRFDQAHELAWGESAMIDGVRVESTESRHWGARMITDTQRGYGGANHASPEQAWAMFKALGAEYVLPVHHSTFRLSREPVDEPIRRFLAAAGNERWRVVASEIGATATIPPARL